MRLNRLTLIGLIVIVGAGLLWVGYSLFGSKNTKVADANATDPNLHQVNATTEPTQRPAGRGYKARYVIPARTILTRDMFVPGALEDPDKTVYVTNFLEEGYGWITKEEIPAGANLEHSQLLGPVRVLGLSAAVNEGQRAIIIPIPNGNLHDVVAVNDTVDVIATFDKVETRVLADGARVIAVDGFGRDYKYGSFIKRGPDAEGPNPPAGPDPNVTPAPGQAAPDPDSPAPTPAPAGNQPPPPATVRETALALEVEPEQATAIAFAKASGAVIDYLIQPRTTPVGVKQLTQGRVTEVMVAPYAARKSRGGAPAAATTKVSKEPPLPRVGGFGGMGSVLPMPPPMPTATPKPTTYSIPIYPDGLPVRVNTVPIPD